MLLIAIFFILFSINCFLLQFLLYSSSILTLTVTFYMQYPFTNSFLWSLKIWLKIGLRTSYVIMLYHHNKNNPSSFLTTYFTLLLPTHNTATVLRHNYDRRVFVFYMYSSILSPKTLVLWLITILLHQQITYRKIVSLLVDNLCWQLRHLHIENIN